jgi:hypothetical protein
MRIGVRSLLIKQLTSEQLGIADPFFHNYVFQHRQKYFHLSMIPVFPVGKYWTMRIKDQYFAMDQEIPMEILEKIYVQGHIDSKTPWYSYLFGILVTCGFLGYMIYDIAKNKFRSTSNDNIVTKSKIDNLKPENVIYFNTEKPGVELYSKVDLITRDSVKFSYAFFTKGTSFPKVISQLFVQKEGNTEVWISKKYLKDIETFNFEASESKVDSVMKIASIISIFDYTSPMLKCEEISVDYVKKVVEISVVNVGVPCKFKSNHIKMANGIVLNLSQDRLNTGEKVYVNIVFPKDYKTELIEIQEDEVLGKIPCVISSNNKEHYLKLIKDFTGFKIKNS